MQFYIKNCSPFRDRVFEKKSLRFARKRYFKKFSPRFARINEKFSPRFARISKNSFSALRAKEVLQKNFSALRAKKKRVGISRSVGNFVFARSAGKIFWSTSFARSAEKLFLLIRAKRGENFLKYLFHAKRREQVFEGLTISCGGGPTTKLGQ